MFLVRLSALVLLSLILCGCSMTGTMVPVEGPLSLLRPVPVMKFKADGIMGNSGKFTFKMPDGDSCSGRWSSAAGAGVTIGGLTLIGKYGPTYGSGYSISSGTGQNPGQAIATCTKGRVVQIEFITGAGTAHGFGIAKDNENNVFKMVF